MPPPRPKSDPFFRSLLPPLSPAEYATLESQILAEGCRTPLVVWVEERVLIDGYNRRDICEKHNVAYLTEELSFPTREAAALWVVQNQMGRRNLTDERRAFFIGLEYRAAVDANAKARAAGQKVPPGKTAEVIAKKYGIDEATVRRAAAFADGVQAMSDEAREAALAGEISRKAARARATRPPPRPARKKAGAPRFDWEGYDKAVAKVVRGLDDAAMAYGERKADEYREAKRLVNELVVVYKKWLRRLNKGGP